MTVPKYEVHTTRVIMKGQSLIQAYDSVKEALEDMKEIAKRRFGGRVTGLRIDDKGQYNYTDLDGEIIYIKTNWLTEESIIVQLVEEIQLEIKEQKNN